MNEYTIIFREGLGNGLRRNQRNPKNIQFLIRSDSAFPELGVLRAVDDLETLDLTALGCEFPFPQIFQLKRFTLICTKDSIYKFTTGLELVYEGLPGTTWSIADFDTFLVLTNGRSFGTLDAISAKWSDYLECSIPNGICVCDLNGQMLVGAPEVSVTEGFLS